MFVPILTELCAQGAIPDSITNGVITLLKKGGRHVWEDLDDYRPITLLNREAVGVFYSPSRLGNRLFGG